MSVSRQGETTLSFGRSEQGFVAAKEIAMRARGNGRHITLLVAVLFLRWPPAMAGEAAEPVTHIRGVVLDDQGRPAGDALVGIGPSSRRLLELQRDQPAWARAQVLYTKADARGRFDLPLPRVIGSVTVVARRAGLTGAKSAELALNAETVDPPP